MSRINWKAIDWSKENKPDIKLYETPREYWVEIEPDTGNPTGHICWAYYLNDKPQKGNWILVKEVVEK